MRKGILKGKNLIAFAIACCLVISLGVYTTNAATHINQPTSNITITVPAELRDDYKGSLSGKLYKVAGVASNGAYEDVVDSKITEAISAYAADNKAEDIDNAIKAASDAKDKTTEVIEFTIGATESSKLLTNIPNGLYLLSFDDSYVEGRIFGYTFAEGLVSAPANYYSKADSNSDSWIHDIDINVKYSKEPCYGSIDITKTLTTYNKSLGSATFVYDIEAERDGQLLYSNVVAIDFNEATTKTITVSNIPAATNVTVKEIYTGATYKLSTDESYVIADLPSDYKVENDPAVARPNVAFTNDYDDRLLTGSISTVNTVSYKVDDETLEGGFALSNVNGLTADVVEGQ